MVHGDAFQMGSVYSNGSDDSNSDSGMYGKSEKAAMLAAMHGSAFGTPRKGNRSEFGTNMSRGTSVAKESYMEDDVLLNDVEEGESHSKGFTHVRTYAQGLTSWWAHRAVMCPRPAR